MFRSRFTVEDLGSGPSVCVYIYIYAYIYR